MAERILISHAHDVDLRPLQKSREQAGAGASEPIAALPDTGRALVDETGVDSFLARASALEGVRHAKRDRPR